MTKSEAGKIGYIASKESHIRQFEERLKKYEESPSQCIHCRKSLPYNKRKNKFCNHICSAKQTNTKRATLKICKNCNRRRTSGKEYCSPKCTAEYFTNSKDKEALAKNDVYLVYKTPKAIKNFILRKDGRVCKICSTTEWNNMPVPLVLDHIDGNSDNWQINNLRLICGNCDMQTPTYKSKNRGNGRFYRRKRYKEGKSF